MQSDEEDVVAQQARLMEQKLGKKGPLLLPGRMHAEKGAKFDSGDYFKQKAEEDAAKKAAGG